MYVRDFGLQGAMSKKFSPDALTAAACHQGTLQRSWRWHSKVARQFYDQRGMVLRGRRANGLYIAHCDTISRASSRNIGIKSHL
jgi:hypothetical protein